MYTLSLPRAIRTTMLLFLAASTAASAFAQQQRKQALALPAPAAAAIPAEASVFPLQPADYDRVRTAPSLTLPGVRLAPDVLADLELSATSAIGRNARLVLQTDAGPMPLQAPPIATFRGHIAGDDTSRVFLSISPVAVYGVVLTPERSFTISSGPAGGDHPALAFDLASLPEGAIRFSDFSCNDDGGDPITPDWSGPPAPLSGGSRSGMPCRRVQIAVDTDYEYLGLFGGNTSNATAYAYSLLAAISEIYERDLNTSLDIVYLRLWSTSADPWTQSNTGSQLNQFRGYWNGTMFGVSRNVAHFLSGRALGGGVAYLPGVCHARYDYGLSANLSGFFPYPLQDHHWQNWDVMVVAHEIGHNFGAQHTHSLVPPADGCGIGDCTGANQGTIMSYCHTCSGGMSNIVLVFHSRNINEDMLPYLVNLSCDLTREQEGDIDNDGDVDSQDLALALAAFGAGPLGDLDGDGTTGPQDLALLLSLFGQSPCN